MIQSGEPKPSFTDRLGVRLAFLLAIVLFPLLLISVIQSLSVLREARARSEAALMGETMRAVSGETRLIQQAQTASALLSHNIVGLVDDIPACTAEMKRVANTLPAISLATFIPVSGLMECASTGTTFDFKDHPLFLKTIASDGPSFIVNPKGPVSGTSILGVAHPVFDANGKKLGIVSISLPHSALALAEDGASPEVDRPLVIMTFDRDGNILTSSGGLETAEQRLPADRALKALAGTDAATFTATSNRGRERVYSVVELVPNELYALGSWPSEAAWSLGPVADIPPLLIPTSMWAVSLLVAYFAMQRLVIDHIRRLSRALTVFASGKRTVLKTNFDGAPREIRDLARAYSKMTETILHDEAELEDTIHHKEVLLREVHHRVKNNLQLVASIINMQIRQARSPEAKGLMKGLQQRVISLATIHRELYQTSGLTDVQAAELLPDIVRQITRLATGPGRRVDVSCEIDKISLTPDQAVPLSLLVTEAMTNAMKYAGGDRGPAQLSVSLRCAGGALARLSVANSVHAEGPHNGDTVDGSGLGSQLIAAFVQQLDGKLSIERDETRYDLIVEFVVRPLAESEARNQPEEDLDEEEEEDERVVGK